MRSRRIPSPLAPLPLGEKGSNGRAARPLSYQQQTLLNLPNSIARMRPSSACLRQVDCDSTVYPSGGMRGFFRPVIGGGCFACSGISRVGPRFFVVTSVDHRLDRNGREYLVSGMRWTKEAPVCELKVAGHRYQIKGSALQELAYAGSGQTRVARPADGVLLIVPSVFAWVRAMLSVVIGVGLLAGCVVYVAQKEWTPETARQVVQAVVLTLLMVGIGIICVKEGALIVTDRRRFDRAAGRAARRYGFRVLWDVDLSEVVAVQCLHAGWFNHLKGGWHDTYQVNLVVRTGDDNRLPVCSEGDGERAARRVRSLAQALAVVLQVPVVDQIDDTWVPQPRASWWE